MWSNTNDGRKPLLLIFLAATLLGMLGAVRLWLAFDSDDHSEALGAWVLLGGSVVLALMGAILTVASRRSERATRRLNAALDIYVERGTAAARNRRTQRQR